MRFYTEERITRDIPDSVYGYFYEAKDLTKHPFLDRYGDDIIKRMGKDYSNWSYLKRFLSTHSQAKFDDIEERQYPALFAELVEGIIDNILHKRPDLVGGQALKDAIADGKIKEPDLKKNFKWIVLRYISRGIFSIEDMEKTIGTIAMFELLKKKNLLDARDKDINRFKTERDLFGVISEPWEAFSAERKSQEDKDKYERLIDEGDISVHYEDNKMIIYVVHTKKGCNATGEGANWCTTGSYYQHYADKGELYTIHIKGKPNEKYHLSFAAHEYVNIKDHYITGSEAKMLKLAKIFPDSVFNKANKEERIEGVSVVADEGQRPLGDYMDAIGLDHSEIDEEVKRDPRFILDLPDEYLEDGEGLIEIAAKASREVAFDLIRRGGHPYSEAFYYLDEDDQEMGIEEMPDEEEKLYAISHTKDEFINLVGDDFQLMYLENEYNRWDDTWKAIEYIENPSVEMQMAAIRQDEDAIDLIEDPHETAIAYHLELWEGQERLDLNYDELDSQALSRQSILGYGDKERIRKYGLPR